MDPDIDTLPFLLWTPELLESKKEISSTVRTFLHYQHYALLPLLVFARFTWTLFSALFAFNMKVRVIAVICMCDLHAWNVGMSCWCQRDAARFHGDMHRDILCHVELPSEMSQCRRSGRGVIACTLQGGFQQHIQLLIWMVFKQK
jgi:hypothetical protein